MTRYTLGFLFDGSEDYVALIHKNRGPNGIVGKWNGIGGKIEEEETPHECMAREFQEEASLVTEPHEWRHFATFGDNSSWEVLCFTLTKEVWDGVFTAETEKVDWWDCEDLGLLPTVPHLSWLIHMAKDTRIIDPPFIKFG